MTAHTPGPWRVEEEGAGLFTVVGGDGMSVAERATAPDARLIAVAPDLLAALIAVLPFVETRWSGAAIAAKADARAALQKAGAL